jgi:hypothetical protein
MIAGPEGSYLARARSLCVRSEVLGGQLIAWSATLLAMGWDLDAIEDVVVFVASLRDEATSADRAWASGLAEGEIEPLSPDGEGILGWGPALLTAVSLAQLSKAGEVLVDGQVRALRAGRLTLVGARVSPSDAGHVRGWRLDLEHPWKPAVGAAETRSPEAFLSPAATEADEEEEAEEVVDLEIEEIADDVPSAKSLPVVPPDLLQPEPEAAAGRFRNVERPAETSQATETLARLRRERARAEGGSPSMRCQASLALALMLSLVGRSEEALLEALDALARAREASDVKAVGACLALLAKLYAGAGYTDAATALRDSIV